VRNPLAHERKILWQGEDDAADYLSLISLLHRKLDDAVKTGFSWRTKSNERLEQAFANHGKLTPAELETLDWPETQVQSAPFPAHHPEYEEWLVKAENKAAGTGRSYSSFLIRCAEHYGEVIDEKTVKTDADANGMIECVKSRVKESTGIYDGRFTSTNIKDGFIPALHAYRRFIQATFPAKPRKS